MRIKAPTAKIGYLLVVVIATTLVAVPLAVISLALGFAWAAASVIAAVVVAARTFRGVSESDAPRPWWKMTSTRGSGILLSVLFFIQGVITFGGAFTSPNPSLAVIGSVLALAVAGFYANSAFRIQPAPSPGSGRSGAAGRIAGPRNR